MPSLNVLKKSTDIKLGSFIKKVILNRNRGKVISTELIFRLDFSDQDFDDVVERFVTAAQAMQEDGFWWSNSELSNKRIKRRVLSEMLSRRLGRSAS